METAVTELVSAIKALAPEVWAIMVKQVIVQSLAWSAWHLFITILLCVSLVYTRRWHLKKEADEDKSRFDWEDYQLPLLALAYTLQGLFLIMMLGMLLSNLIMLGNPEFYAIQLLIGLVK